MARTRRSLPQYKNVNWFIDIKESAEGWCIK